MSAAPDTAAATEAADTVTRWIVVLAAASTGGRVVQFAGTLFFNVSTFHALQTR